MTTQLLFAGLRALRVRELRNLRDLSMFHARSMRDLGCRGQMERNIRDARRLNRRAIEEGRAAGVLS